MYGPEKKVVVEPDNAVIKDLIKKEKSWRDTIIRGVDYVQMVRLIKSSGVQVDGHYEITKSALVDEGIMIGWNAHQIYEKIVDMQKQGMLRMKDGLVIYED